MQCMKKLSLVVAVISLSYAQAHAGAITVYTALEEDEIAAYLKAANAAMPDLKVNVLRLSTGDLGARLIAEASNPQQDVIWGFAVSNMLDPRLQNLLEPYAAKGMDALPAQYKGADKKWFAATGYVAAFCVNTDRLKSKNLPMPTSWEDLAKPVYKGEIVIPSPAASGTGYLQIVALLQGLGQEKRLGPAQGPGQERSAVHALGLAPLQDGARRRIRDRRVLRLPGHAVHRRGLPHQDGDPRQMGGL